MKLIHEIETGAARRHRLVVETDEHRDVFGDWTAADKLAWVTLGDRTFGAEVFGHHSREFEATWLTVVRVSVEGRLE